MTSSEKKAFDEADLPGLFRFRMVSAVLAREELGELRSVAIAQLVRDSHSTSDQGPKHVSTRSLYRWLHAFEANGFEGLLSSKPTPRPSNQASPGLLAFMRSQKLADPAASVPELIRRAEQEKLVKPGQLSRSTLWRILKQHGISTKRCKHTHTDKRRFAYAHRMQMVLCDGKHFRAGHTRAKRVALFFLDDATRFLLAALVGTSESTQLFLNGLSRCIRDYGLMQRLFLDNGPGFSSAHSETAVAQLGIHLIHGTPGYPQGRGKVERFNRTIAEDLLRHLDRAADVDSSCESLTRLLNHYIQQIYHHRPHSGLENATPYERFYHDPVPLRFPDERVFQEAFFAFYPRKVSADLTISLGNTHYEVPGGYANRTLMIRKNLLDGTVEMIHEDRYLALKPVDLYANARRTATPAQPPTEETDAPLPPSSALLRFAGDFAPIVDPEGNYYDFKEKS